VNESVYQRVLGERFDELSPQLRTYFASPPPGSAGRGTGVFEVAGPRHRLLWPAFAVLASRRVLFPERARDVPFTVTNVPGPGDGLSARREFHLPGRDRLMVDTMHVVDGALHDFVGRRGGLEVRFVLDVVDGALRMTSDRAWLHLGAVRVPLPALLSARVRLTESWAGAVQRVDVQMRHPLLGLVFEYRGAFTYAYESLD
jgi:hypothetical protein